MKKIIAISLALILLLSNMGFTLASHYCKGELASTSITLGTTATGCGMENNEPCDAEQNSISETSCCTNQLQALSIGNDYNQTVEANDLNTQFIISFVYTFVINQYPETNTQSVYTNYSPPPIQQNTQVLFQTFLI